jgi:hypothetical protein
LLSYDFRDADGGGVVYREGRSSRVNNPNYSFIIFCRNQRDNQDDFHLEAIADRDVTGPDGKPGVLRFQVRELPSDMAYFGFSLAGTSGPGAFRISHWRPGAVGQAELQELTLSFRYKSTRSWTMRLEPLDNSYRNRLDFGPLPASTEWATFSKRFSDATNVELFLQHVNASGGQAPKVKLSWCSTGFDYAPGDTLLITDVRIERRPAGVRN